MVRIAVIVTSHNRHAQTVRCLQALSMTAARMPEIGYHVYLMDDGSSDGTAQHVEALGLPATILRGTGDLYWNRGMHRAWEAALATNPRYDAFLLLNDDTMLDADGLERLVAVARQTEGRAIVVGAVRDPDTGTLTYGGVRRRSRWHPGRVATLQERNEPQGADTFNGNCVLVPASVCDVVGTLDPTFQHGMGDFDYGYRARKHGFDLIVAANTVGTCARNDPAGTWRDAALPLRKRLALLASPKGLPRREWCAFLARHGAPAADLLSWVPTLKVVSSWLAGSMLRRRRA